MNRRLRLGDDGDAGITGGAKKEANDRKITPTPLRNFGPEANQPKKVRRTAAIHWRRGESSMAVVMVVIL
ncbi:uncharacterized protein LOC100711570 [Anopheles sinensis]|uniref:Uncharacterized protein LOC100711570 n=1 Tax=Anopheles sinensis TaxID=74873 RepID=A0A084VYI8_ANOSI|nr:uncharacterized protein LOC100711570 [Anopheles sinensis]